MKDSDWEILNELYHNPNMTRVANLLYMTQPSLTKRLQHMEEEFGTVIVERTPRGLKFTPEGDYLCQQAMRYLAFLKETKQHLNEMQTSAVTTITIGSSYTYSKYALSDLLIRYRHLHPQVRFMVINEKSDLLFRKLLDETIDVGFIQGDYEGAVHRVLVGRSKAYLVTKEPLTEPVRADQLLRMQYIGYKTNEQTLSLLNTWWQDHFKMDAPAEMVVGYVDVAWQLIARGSGYTCCFLPENYVNEYDLCLTPLIKRDGSEITRSTWFIYSGNKRIPEEQADFIAFVEQIIAERKKQHEEH